MIGRNDKCPCGSGKKYKKCCLNKIDIEFYKGMREAAKFNSSLMQLLKYSIKEGITTEKLNKIAEEYINDHGNKSACLGYHSFPKSICTSLNDEVCHGIPSDKVILKESDILKIDVSTIVNGYYGDQCETIPIGNINQKAGKLIDIALKALQAGIQAVEYGKYIKEIAESIQFMMDINGYSIVREFMGHGIGKEFHQEFSVFHHIDDNIPNIKFKPGMAFTIEPMINIGSWETYTADDGWTVKTKDGSLSAQFEHTLLLTESNTEKYNVEIITKIV